MGMSAIQIAKLCGARVIAAASDDDKLKGMGGGERMSAIQIAKLCGARVIAVASDDDKLKGMGGGERRGRGEWG